MDQLKIIQREVMEYFIDHPGTVCILLINPINEIVLVRVSRYNSTSLEIPGGIRERNETYISAVKRELFEETGYSIQSCEKMCTFTTSNGITNEIVRLYLCYTTTQPKKVSTGELVTRFYPLNKVLKMIQNGRITDSKTIIAVLWYIAYKRQPASNDTTAE